MAALFTVKAETRARLLILTREQFGKVLEQHRELGPLLRKSVLKQLRRWEQTNLEELDSCCLRKVGVTLL
jgi:CRP-like cAMP-binding protein